MTERRDGLHIVDNTGEEPLVVLVHGSLDRGTSFARVVRRLSDLHVVTYDRRGYHRSRRAKRAVPVANAEEAGPRVFDEHVNDLLGVVGSRAAVVVGHSFGADIALAAAVADPVSIRAVGAYEPPLPWLDWWPRRPENDVVDEDPGDRAEAFFRRVVSDEAWERLSHKTREERRADGPALIAELKSLRAGGAPFDLTQVTQPIVLGRGGRSIPHHRRAIDALEAIIPDTVVWEIPQASHGAHLSHPDSFADFVRTVVSRARVRVRSEPAEHGEKTV